MQQPSELQKQIEELELEHERLRRAKLDLIVSLGMTEEGVQELVNNPDAFPQGQWEEFCKMREKMIQDIQRDVDSIPDPKKTEETRKNLHLPPNALFCR